MRIRHRHPRCVLAALGLLALTLGCRSTDTTPATGSSAGAPGDALEACALLTEKEITTVLGAPPGTPESTPGRFAASCKWPSADGRDQEYVHVLVSTSSVASFEDYDRRGRHAMGARADHVPVRQVEGLGDFAVWAGDDESGALQVFGGGRLLQVTVARTDDRTAPALAEALVRAALPRFASAGS